jgi:aminopeptidase N
MAKELAEGLKDKYGPLREYTLKKLAATKTAPDATILNAAEALIAKEKDKKAKAAAISLLVKTGDAKYLPIYKANVNDSSYTVAGAALEGLAALEPANAYSLAKKYSTDAKGDLGAAVDAIIIENGTEADFDFIAERFDKAPVGQSKFEALDAFCTYLTKISNSNSVKKGVDMVVKFRNAIPEAYRNFTDPAIKDALKKVSAAKGKDVESYIAEKMK